MYPAIKLYPKRTGSAKGYKTYEMLALTYHTIERLDSMKQGLYEHSLSIEGLSYYLHMDRRNVINLITRRQNPSLEGYLKLSEVFDWDLSRDVNYAYAMVMYPPAEIKRRLQRVFSLSLTLKSIASFFCIHGYGEITMIYDSMTYGYYRNSRVYASVMRKLALYEKLLGYSDALRFEE